LVGVRSIPSRPRFIWLAAAIFLSATVGACITNVPAPEPTPQAEPFTPSSPPPVPPGPEAVQPTPLPPGSKVPVALLLPLSGPSAALGQGMLDSALMAVYDAGASQVRLMPHDTGGGPRAAADGARAAIKDGARLIIGPLLAADVEAVKPVAQAANVPVLAFSTTAGIAGAGVYLLSFQPRQEIERVVAYAHAQGVNRFAILAPRTPYGQLATAAMQEAVAANQSQLIASGDYEPSLSSLNDAAQRFAHQGTNYDALLLPDGGTRLKALAPYLAYNNIDTDKIHLLGTGLWDDPSLGSEATLVHGWYAAPDPEGRRSFERRFRDAEGHPPPRLATLAYDATALAAVLAKSPEGPDYSVAALTNPSGFVGLDGIFRLNRDGLVERGLAVLEVERGGARVIDPAPQSFVGATQ
jgi:branched-chain amino acid transport system substrate-binding protein